MSIFSKIGDTLFGIAEKGLKTSKERLELIIKNEQRRQPKIGKEDKGLFSDKANIQSTTDAPNKKD